MLCCLTCLDQIGNVAGQLLNSGIVELLDILQHPLVLLGHEVDGNSLSAKPTATTDTVKVVLWLGRQVVVDDQRHLQAGPDTSMNAFVAWLELQPSSVG